MGEELHEILQKSSNEVYIENKHNEGSNVEIDKEADETEESALQGGRQWQKKQEGATASCTLNQTILYKSGIE